MPQNININSKAALHNAAFFTSDGEPPVGSPPSLTSGSSHSGRKSPETQVFAGSPGGSATAPLPVDADAFAARLASNASSASVRNSASGLVVGQNALSPVLSPPAHLGEGGAVPVHDDLRPPAMPAADGQHDGGLAASQTVSNSSFSDSKAAIQQRLQSWGLSLPDAKAQLDAILADFPDPELRGNVIATALKTCRDELSKFSGLKTDELYQSIVENIVAPLLSDKCCCIEAKAWYAAPLDVVRRKNRLELFTLLARHGATATVDDIKYCLQKPRADHLEIIKNFIVEGKTNVNNCDGYTILGLVINMWSCCSRGEDSGEKLFKIITYLVEEHHADPSLPNRDGDLYCAADAVLQGRASNPLYTKAALYLLSKLNHDDLERVCSRHSIEHVDILQCIIRNGVIPDFSCLAHLTDSSSFTYTTQTVTPEIFQEFVADGVHACNASESERKNFTKKLLSNISDAVVGKYRKLEIDKTQNALAVLNYIRKDYQKIGCIDVEKYLDELIAPMRILVHCVDANKEPILAAKQP